MSRSTPRKSRHRHQASSGGGGGGLGPRGIAASDYESDAAHYLEGRDLPPPAQIPPRTNTELNLSVLRRYLPSIHSILSIAANAVVYTFAHAEQSWDKSGVEGTLFVCEQDAVAVNGQLLPRACVFILNRRGLDNVIVDLARVNNCELAGEFLMFQLPDAAAENGSGGHMDNEDQAGGAPPAPNVLGLWMHAAENDDTREVNATVIKETWRQVRLAAEAVMAEGTEADAVLAESQDQSVGPAMQALGRKVSLGSFSGERTATKRMLDR